ncbi:MAG TPA: PRC-barrel domain-containing protein [Alphaproteobacteria bacterium]|nr:PRC-barrel domain-containing protein [Alphaproteobacteria bacterium]
MSTQTLHEIKDNNATAAGLNINRKDLSSMSIYGSDGKKIAGVDKVLGDNSNQIKAVTADVGGFLGVGSKEVVIPVDMLQKGKDKNQLQTSLTKDQIKNLEQYASSGNSRSGSVGGSAPSSQPGGAAAPPRRNP